MSAYVSDWSQEVYGDFRRYAVPGAPITLRRDYLNEYLEHALVLARAGPPTIELARGFLQTAFSPVANAAWQYESGYGWTLVPFDQMQAFVSAQVYALRSASVALGLAQDHWGFAWQPRNGSGLSTGDFNAQTSQILDRLGAAIRDSGQVDPNDPGSGACGPPGQNVFCVGDFTGALFNESWKALRTWFGSVLAFSTPPQTLVAGQPSAPITPRAADELGRSAGDDDADRRSADVGLARRAVLAQPRRSVGERDQRDDSRRRHRHAALLLPRHARRAAADSRDGNRSHHSHADRDRRPRARFEAGHRSGLGGHRPARVAAVRRDGGRCFRKPAHRSRDLERQAGSPRGRAAEGGHGDQRQGRRARRQRPCRRASRRDLREREPEGESGPDTRVVDPLLGAAHGRSRHGDRLRGGRGAARAVRTSVVVRRNGRAHFSASKRTDAPARRRFSSPAPRAASPPR